MEEGDGGVEALAARTDALTIGQRPQALLLCEYADHPAPLPREWYVGAMSNRYGGLDHYFRQVSYGQLNLGNSKVFGWYRLAAYDSYPNEEAREDACVAAADPEVYYPEFTGIVWIPSYLPAIDYATGKWIVDDSGFANAYSFLALSRSNDLRIFAHELLHPFGIGHTGPGYFTEWEPAGTGGVCTLPFPYTGCLPDHPNGFWKDSAGWIPSERKYVQGSSGGAFTITLERLGVPPATGFLWAKVPIAGSSTHFYSIETRKRGGVENYDVSIPGEAVLIHDVDLNRWEPLPWVVDGDTLADQWGNPTPNDEGAMWKPGETYVDALNGIRVSVNYETLTGFSISVQNDPFQTLSLHTSGTGRVVSRPAGLDCAGDCSAAFYKHSVVELEASGGDATTATFSGCDSVQWGVCRVTMSSARNVSVTLQCNRTACISSCMTECRRDGGLASQCSAMCRRACEC
jgi:hypothetical protein